MEITAEGLESWIGSEVIDPHGEKLGKVNDLYYRGNVPVIVEIASGLTGRKHHLGDLRGATVTRDYLRIATTTVIPTPGGITDQELGALGEAAPDLAGTRLADLEGYHAREERLQAAAEAAARADALEAEARQRAEEERQAAAQANAASQSAVDARAARQQAEADAAQARSEAESRQR